MKYLFFSLSLSLSLSLSVCFRSWNQELQKWEQKKKETQHENQSKENDDSPRLDRALIRVFWKEYLFAGILLAVEYAGLLVFSALILSWIVSYFKIDDEAAGTTTKNDVLSYVCYLVLCLIFSVFFMHHSDLWSQEIGMRIRVACCSLIYRKVRVEFDKFILKIC